MAEAWRRQSALAHLRLLARAVGDPGEAGVGLSEKWPAAQIAVRGEIDDAAFLAAFERGAQLALPLAANTVSGGGERSVFWLGPSEWLLVSAEEEAKRLLQWLRPALAGTRHALTDVSDSRAVITVEGPRARDLLGKACSLDLDRLTPGMCARTTLARVGMLLQPLHRGEGRPPAWDLYVHRSQAEYAWRWLEDAAQEYGVAVLAG